jgi:TolA-binding protein
LCWDHEQILFNCSCIQYSNNLREHSQKQKHHAHLASYQTGKTAVLAKTQLPSAINSLQTYLKLNITEEMPDKEWAEFRLGQLYWLQGNKVEAEKLFNKVKRIAKQSKDEILQEQLQAFLADNH